MENGDKSGFSAHDIPAALGLLTRLPVHVDAKRAEARGAAAAWAYPLVGAVLSFLLGAPALALVMLGLPAEFAAALLLAAAVIVTGGLHEDGLADAADGLWGGWDKERRLEIMKDSRIGSYGVLALVLSMLLRWLGLSAVLASQTPLIALAALWMGSRAAMPALMAVLPNARQVGLAAHVGRPAPLTAAAAAGLAAVVALAGLGGTGVILCAAIAAAACGCALVARAKIGGQTGDILGATQQVCEITGLLCLALLVST